jgi:hypothetical protein
VSQRFASPTRDHRDMVPLLLPGLDRQSIADVESLDFLATCINEDRTIRENAIDIEAQQRDLTGV